MTYSTCWIDKLVPVDIPAVPDIKFVRQEFARDLDAPQYGGFYWLSLVRNWANAHNKDIHYRDNCWIEVELSADELRNFLHDIYGSEGPAPLTLMPRIDNANSYILEAEEF